MRKKEYIIHVDWDGPYSLNDLSSIMDEKVDYGVYQIYGTHPVYGNSVLLYIGKADRQTFGVRISQEHWDCNSDAERLKIYVGRLAGNCIPSDEQWSREIDLCEKLLIFSHKPAYNTQNLNSVPDYELQEMHILNWGYYCDLMPEVSGARWTNKYDLMENYEVYGDHNE